MAFCTNCGHQLADGAKFCYECGAATKLPDHTSAASAENADIEIGISVLLNNDNRQDFTQNEVYLVHAHKTVSVRVPNWITVGQMVRLRGEGNATRSGKKGDLLLRIDHIEYKESNNQPPIRKVGYDGEIRKCPNCGDLMDPFEIKCDACGYELRSAKATDSIKEFEQKLENTKNTDSRIALIKTFAIPNAKEDIYDFFILAIANIQVGGEEVDAWLAKLEQTYQKARLLFGTNSDFSYFQELYDKARKQKKRKQVYAFISKWWMCLLGALVAVIGFYMMIMGEFKGAESGDGDSPYYMMALMAMYVIAGGAVLFGFGIKHNVGKSKNKK